MLTPLTLLDQIFVERCGTAAADELQATPAAFGRQSIASISASFGLQRHSTDSTRFYCMRSMIRYDQNISECCRSAFLFWSVCVSMTEYPGWFSWTIPSSLPCASEIRTVWWPGLALAACELCSGVGLQLEKRLSHVIPRLRHDVCRRAWHGWVRRIRHWHDQPTGSNGIKNDQLGMKWFVLVMTGGDG